MATPRSQLIDPEIALHYHLVSRCVRQSWLCGRDRKSGRNYNHRKSWLKDRLFFLAQYFAIEIDAFAIMDNHFHLVVYFDPKESTRWSDSEVAYRWAHAFPEKTTSTDAEELELTRQLHQSRLLKQPERLNQCRKTLGSLSDFMKHLKQPIARRANKEDRCTGHFFEGRFYSGALLSEDAVLAAMAYVDLNPVRAKIADSIETCRDSSISMRLKATASTPERLEQALIPLVSGINESDNSLPIHLDDYCAHLNLLIKPQGKDTVERETIWFNQVASFRKRRRAYGALPELEHWHSRMGWKRSEIAMPA